MGWKAFIGGVDRTANLRLEDAPTISLLANERSTAKVTCLPGYLPAARAEVLLYEQDGITPIFGGIVWQRHTRLFEGLAYADLDLADWGAYADNVYQTKTYTVPVTMKQVLQDLITDKLGAFGITLDPAQPTGPTFEAFSWVNKKVSDGIREISDKTTSPKYLARYSPGKVLSMFPPAGEPAPFNVSDVTPNCESVTWEDSGTDYATRVLLECGPPGTVVLTSQTFPVCTGVETSWQTDIPAVTTTGVVWVDDGVTPFNATVGADAMFEWDNATHTLSVGTYGTPAAGVILTLRYYAVYPFTVIADAGITPAIEYATSAPDVVDKAAGQELADGLLARMYQQPKTVVVITRLPGLIPRQSISVVLTSSLIDETVAFITIVSIVLVEKAYWRYTATVVSGSEYLGSYLDFFRETSGGSGGLSIIEGTGGGVLGGLPAPVPLGGSRFHAVQVTE
jgi:hypothetical protein